MQSIGLELLPLPALPSRHPDLDVDGTGVVSQAEVGPQIVLRKEAAARADLAQLLFAPGADRDLCADREPVPGRGRGAHRDPVALRRLPVLQQRRRIVHVVDDEVEIAVVVEITDSEAAANAGDLQTRAGAIRHVAEPRAQAQQQLVLLPVGLPELRVLLDVREDVAVGKEQIERAVEIGVEERRAPSHADERRAGDVALQARVLELAAVDVVIQRVPIARERREHEIHAPVAVVVARVRSHSRLRACVTVERHARRESDVLETSVAGVVVQEVGVRVVRHEQIDEAVVVVVGRDDAEAVGASRVGQTVRGGGFDEASAAGVLEEEIGFAGQARGSDHDVRTVTPDEIAPRLENRVPGRLDVARDVEIQVAVAVGVEERAAGAPAAGRHARAGGDILERAVAAIPEQRIRSPVGDVEIEAAVAVEVAGAGAAAPRRQVDPRCLRHVLELPSAEVAVERIAMRDALARRAELCAGDQVDVEQSVAVVVEQGDAAARRFEDVILCRAAAEHLRRQPRAFLEGDQHGCGVFR